MIGIRQVIGFVFSLELTPVFNNSPNDPINCDPIKQIPLYSMYLDIVNYFNLALKHFIFLANHCKNIWTQIECKLLSNKNVSCRQVNFRAQIGLGFGTHILGLNHLSEQNNKTTKQQKYKK